VIPELIPDVIPVIGPIPGPVPGPIPGPIPIVEVVEETFPAVVVPSITDVIPDTIVVEEDTVGGGKTVPPIFPWLPGMPKLSGGTGGAGLKGISTPLSEWLTRGMFVGITDPRTGKVLVGGIQGRKRIKYGAVESQGIRASKITGGQNGASVGKFQKGTRGS